MSVNDFIQDYINDKDQYFSIFKLKEQPPKIRMSQIWEREYPFFGSRHPPFMAGEGTPHLYKKVTPPSPGPQEGGGGIVL